MISRKFIKTEKPQIVEVGSILVAQPFWQDEKYKRSVILLLNHDSIGSTGIILNKQTTLFVKEALPVITINPPLYYGGPFDTHTVSYIHNNPAIPEAVHIGNELYWGGNFEYLEEMIRNKQIDLRKIKFFAGFVEWSVGQLESEINEDKWWTSEFEAHELFTTSTEELWSHELLANGHIYGLLDEFPDPSLN